MPRIRQFPYHLHLYVGNNRRVTEQALIQACIRQERKAQKMLYEQYAPLVMGICRRYLKSEEDAEDTLVETMYKVLAKLAEFKSEGSFEGWIRRIAVNECLMSLRKNQRMSFSEDLQDFDMPTAATVTEQLNMEEILHALDSLPAGYRTVFNLYAVEGYKHREIADMMGISINTSKSQFALAKERMQAILQKRGFG